MNESRTHCAESVATADHVDSDADANHAREHVDDGRELALGRVPLCALVRAHLEPKVLLATRGGAGAKEPIAARRTETLGHALVLCLLLLERDPREDFLQLCRLCSKGASLVSTGSSVAERHTT